MTHDCDIQIDLDSVQVIQHDLCPGERGFSPHIHTYMHARMHTHMPDCFPWTTNVVNKYLACEGCVVHDRPCNAIGWCCRVVVPVVILIILIVYKCRCAGCPPSQTDERQPLLQNAEPTYTGLWAVRTVSHFAPVCQNCQLALMIHVYLRWLAAVVSQFPAVLSLSYTLFQKGRASYLH